MCLEHAQHGETRLQAHVGHCHGGQDLAHHKQRADRAVADPNAEEVACASATPCDSDKHADG